jgi:ABC-type thiamine transport system substrate-binding protein
MKRDVLLAAGLVFIALLLVCPAQAFTAKSLDIQVTGSGDATITFGYDLSWFEHAAVFARIGDPGTELKKALESNFQTQVQVTAADAGMSQFYVKGFATRQVDNGVTTMKTPALSFREAETVLKQYWFAPLISPDFSPDVTRVSFPDGYTQTFYNQDQIPGISHVLS